MDLRFPAQGNPKADACFPCPDSAMKELLNNSHREANKGSIAILVEGGEPLVWLFP